jgi:hypothetical protein
VPVRRVSQRCNPPWASAREPALQCSHPSALQRVHGAYGHTAALANRVLHGRGQCVTISKKAHAPIRVIGMVFVTSREMLVDSSCLAACRQVAGRGLQSQACRRPSHPTKQRCVKQEPQGNLSLSSVAMQTLPQTSRSSRCACLPLGWCYLQPVNCCLADRSVAEAWVPRCAETRVVRLQTRPCSGAPPTSARSYSH